MTGTWKRQPRQKNKSKDEQESLLMKRVTRDTDEEMGDVEGSKKRRAVCSNDLSVEAGDQPRRQQ